MVWWFVEFSFFRIWEEGSVLVGFFKEVIAFRGVSGVCL